MLGHRNGVEHLAFTADGKSIVSASLDGCVKAWHVATGEFLCDLWKSETNTPVRIALNDKASEVVIRLRGGEVVSLSTGVR